MKSNEIVALRSVELGVIDLARASRFYTQAWGLEPMLLGDDMCLFRATGPEHHVVRLRGSPVARLLGIDFAAPDKAAVERLHGLALAAGHAVLAPPQVLPILCGGGYGFDVASPDGLRIGISAGVVQHQDVRLDKTRPTKLTHVVVNSANAERQVAWCQDFLGFRISDSTRNQVFLRCGADHHSLAFVHGTGLSLNHAAFEMADIDGLMYGAGRLIDHGHRVEWGLGRHGPGKNVFSYFVDPEGFAIEYTTEVEQIDEATYVAHAPAYWTEFPRRPCRWGVARKPSAQLTNAFAGKTAASQLE